MRRSAFHGQRVLHHHLRKGPIRGGLEEAVGEVTVVDRSKPHRLLHELLRERLSPAEPGTVNFGLSKVQGRVIRRSLWRPLPASG